MNNNFTKGSNLNSKIEEQKAEVKVTYAKKPNSNIDKAKSSFLKKFKKGDNSDSSSDLDSSSESKIEQENIEKANKYNNFQVPFLNNLTQKEEGEIIMNPQNSVYVANNAQNNQIDVDKPLIAIDQRRLKKAKENLKGGFTEIDCKKLGYCTQETLQKIFKEGDILLIRYLELNIETMNTYIHDDFKKITVEDFKDGVLNFTYESDDASQEDLIPESLHITKIVDLMINKNLYIEVKEELGFGHQENVTSIVIPETTVRLEQNLDPKKNDERAPMTFDEKTLGSQVTYYFGDKNYFRDKFILNHVNQDKRKCMPTKYMMNFRLIKNITEDFQALQQALIKFSKDPMCTYELLDDGDMIKKKSVVV